MALQANRVVVTGIGVIASLGVKKNKVFFDILNQLSGIQKLEGPEWENLPCRVAGVIPKDVFNIEEEFERGDLRDKSKPILYALAAAKRALRDSMFEAKSPDVLKRCGVSIGMGMPDLQEIYSYGKLLEEKGYKAISPYFIPRNLTNMAAGHVSIASGFQGPHLALSTACATGLHAIGEGFKMIERGDADAMLCGGTEAPICPLSMAGFSRMKALCTDSNDEPSKASRPFDKSRSGFVMSEGSAVVLLESRKQALSRGARIYAEIQGYGLSGDAYHISAPHEDGDGAYRCMKAALHDAMLSPEDITYVNAHATSTPLGDSAEAKAIDRLFRRNRKPVAVSSIKGSLGHLQGAAGSVEAAMTMLACYHGYLPPNLNLEEPDVSGNFELITKPNLKWEEETRIALTNSYGFGGTNASLCISNHPSRLA